MGHWHIFRYTKPPMHQMWVRVEKMKQKKLDWGNCLQGRPLTRWEVWYSFDHELFAAMTRGRVAIVGPPNYLEVKMLNATTLCSQSFMSSAASSQSVEHCMSNLRAQICQKCVVVVFAKKVHSVKFNFNNAIDSVVIWACNTFLIKADQYDTEILFLPLQIT